MPLPQKYEKLLHLPANTVGRDFVVGDLHGCRQALIEMMVFLNFNLNTDRMFSVGDLVDRGSENRECAELIYEPWFFSVKGNHEDMMIGTLVGKNSYTGRMWIGNGGLWHISEDKTELTDIATDMASLPLMIAVGEGDQRFNIVHAELIHTREEDRHNVRVPITDEMIDDWVFSEEEENGMLWGRTIISNGHPTFPPPAHQLWHDLEKMSLTFVGHTPVREPVICQRQMYIDGGAVFHYRDTNKSEQNTLVVACPTEKTLYKYILAHEQFVAIPFDQLQQLS
jgi:serine/threonine protein phosphatase 1